MLADDHLLHQFVEERSDQAFAELVRRHVNLVYFAALRRVGGDAHLADDIAQRVFADLARKAPQLLGRTALAGWLYTSTRYAAAHAVRTEQRRRRREQEAQMMQELEATPEADWNQLRPVIDEVMDELSESDREAVLLRFFENQPLAAVGARFAVSADAARMRVDRALEKLRVHLAKRGIASSTAGLTTVFAWQAKLSAPAGVAGQIARRAVSRVGPATSATWKVAKLATIGAAAVVTAGVALYGIRAAQHSGESAAASLLPPAPAVTALPAPMAAGPQEAPDQGPVAEGAEESAPTAPPAAAAGTPLPDAQKQILKVLWTHEKQAPNRRPMVWSIHYSAANPRYAELEAAAEQLQAHGLVGIKPATGRIFLTPRGARFCAAHARELEMN